MVVPEAVLDEPPHDDRSPTSAGSTTIWTERFILPLCDSAAEKTTTSLAWESASQNRERRSLRAAQDLAGIDAAPLSLCDGPAMQPTERFTDRVDTYVRHRPSYPPEILRAIREGLHVAPPAACADIGAGTGIFSALLLDEGFGVVAVEPNDAMRDAAVRMLGGRPRFEAIRGTAEATGLPDASVDFVTAAQAFHWFDPPRAKVELTRVTRAPHPVALVWNSRSLDATPFLRAYDALLVRLSDDYVKVRNHNLGEATFAAFFGPRGYERRVFPTRQELDRDAFLGRVLSSSYVPGASHPRHAEVVAAMHALFDAHEEAGHVAFLYDTEVYLGFLT